MFEALVIVIGGCLGTAIALVGVWALMGVHDYRAARWLARERELDLFYETNQPKGDDL